VLILAEGVLHYFQEAEVRLLFEQIARRLPGAELVFHSTSPRCVGYHHRSPIMRNMAARFRWGIESGREVLSWISGLELVDEWAFIDQHPARWRWLRWAAKLPYIGQELRAAMKITQVRFPD
jgi:O-methyltransferase involved in polyketide biosynthesis